MAAIRHIRHICADDPEREAQLIGSVFHQMQDQMLHDRAERREVSHA